MEDIQISWYILKLLFTLLFVNKNWEYLLYVKEEESRKLYSKECRNTLVPEVIYKFKNLMYCKSRNDETAELTL